MEYNRRTKTSTTNNQYIASTREKHLTVTTTKRTELQSRMLCTFAQAARINECWYIINAASSVAAASRLELFSAAVQLHPAAHGLCISSMKWKNVTTCTNLRTRQRVRRARSDRWYTKFKFTLPNMTPVTLMFGRKSHASTFAACTLSVVHGARVHVRCSYQCLDAS